MKAKLTQEMIDQGQKENQCLCPVALLMKSVYPNAKVQVDVDFPHGEKRIPYVKVDGNEVVFTQPEKVAEFIIRFDNGKSVKPTFFEWEDF